MSVWRMPGFVLVRGLASIYQYCTCATHISSVRPRCRMLIEYSSPFHPSVCSFCFFSSPGLAAERAQPWRKSEKLTAEWWQPTTRMLVAATTWRPRSTRPRTCSWGRPKARAPPSDCMFMVHLNVRSMSMTHHWCPPWHPKSTRPRACSWGEPKAPDLPHLRSW